MPTPIWRPIRRHSSVSRAPGLSWSLLLSQAMESVTRAFYSRSDLDLILTSPASARKVFAVRMGRIATAAVAIAVLLAAPFINVWHFSVAAVGSAPMASWPHGRGGNGGSAGTHHCLVSCHRRQAYAPHRANRGRGDRRGLRHRPASRGDFLCRQPLPFHGVAIGLDAAACACRRQRLLVAGTRRARRLPARSPWFSRSAYFSWWDRSRCSHAASANTRWRRRASPAPP